MLFGVKNPSQLTASSARHKTRATRRVFGRDALGGTVGAAQIHLLSGRPSRAPNDVGAHRKQELT
jgi:hypothetical protein